MAGQSARFDDQDDPNASFTKNHERGGEIAVIIESLKPVLPYHQSKCCIYKVSNHIRQSNEKAYTPRVISIGPFHRNNPKLQTMESLKLRYLESFRKRVEAKLEDIVSTIKDEKDSVRECYSDRETLPPDSDDFVKMILFDASFIIEYFWKNKSKVNWDDDDREILKPWLCNRLQMDLILLENQLPFFIIKKIYDTAFPSRTEIHPFIELSFCQFEYYNVQKFLPHSEWEQILHFTDLVRNFCMPPSKRRPERNSEIKEMHSAAQLARVGLKFKMSTSSNIRSPIELKYEDGVLEIPRFQLDDTTEIFARNLVALEQYHYCENPYITDYYTLLSFLIKTVKDLDVLVREKIIVNRLDDVVATSVLNMRILETIDYSGMNVYYGDLAEKLNKFYHFNEPSNVRRYLHIMMATLKNEYFYNPWRGAATIGGILVLLLTVIQTVCALNSVTIWK